MTLIFRFAVNISFGHLKDVLARCLACLNKTSLRHLADVFLPAGHGFTQNLRNFLLFLLFLKHFPEHSSMAALKFLRNFFSKLIFIHLFKLTEAVICRCSTNIVFLKVFQNSQENGCVGVSF